MNLTPYFRPAATTRRNRRPAATLLLALLSLLLLPTLSGAQTGDFNQDGNPDLLLQNRTSNDAYLFYLNGADYTTYASDNLYVLQGVLSGTNWKIVGTPDLNRDGFPDILIQNLDSKAVYILYMQGSDYTALQQYNKYILTGELSGTNWLVVGTPDLNQDGNPDLLLQNQDTNAVYVIYLKGDDWTSYQAYNKYIFTNELSNTAWKVVGTPDQNNDTNPDILIQNQDTNAIYILYMNGDDYLYYQNYNTYILTDELTGTGWKVAATPDFNKDGFPDILIQNQDTNDLYYFYMYYDDYSYYSSYNNYLLQGGLTGTQWKTASPIWNILGL